MNPAIVLPPSLQERIEQAAAAQGMSPEAFVRAILEMAQSSATHAPTTPGNAQANGILSPPTQRFLPGSEELTRMLADDRWILEQENQGALEAYEGRFIAVYDRQIIAHDSTYQKAQSTAARKLSPIPKEQIAIRYVAEME